jgi:hypothetical protein
VPWWRESDTFADDPRWWVLARDQKGSTEDNVDRLQAAYSRIQACVSHQKDNGYLTHHTALHQCRGRGWVIDALCTAVLDRPAMLHRKGDECSCLGDEWVAGFDYRMHDFLRRNPSRAEYERHREQKADRSDARLRQLVKTRDASCCRYCRSGPLSAKASRARDRRKWMHLDHVDPDQPAGPNGENYVVACAGCSEYKGRRTPDEADMVLLPEPTPTERAEWSTRDRLLFDRTTYLPGDLAGHATPDGPINAESNHQSIKEQINEQRPGVDCITDPNSDPTSDPTNTTTGSPRLEQAEQHQNPGRIRPGNPSGSGGVGPPADRSPPRTSRYPDPYHRRSRADPQPIPNEHLEPKSNDRAIGQYL